MKGLYGLFFESSRRYTDKAFVQSTDRIWTYSDVESMSRNISDYMFKRGVRKGDRVVILCDNSIQYIAAFFGTLKINAVAVPVNPAKMTDSIIYIIEKCTPKLIVTCNSTAGKLDKIQSTYCLDIVNVDQCVLWPNSGYDSSPVNEQDFTVDENDTAEILFTSGTTANPKGVTLTHGNLMANTEAIIDYLKLTSEDSVLLTMPFTYSYGNSILLTHTFVGGTIVIENAATFPYKVLEGIKGKKVSGFSTVGSYINLLLKYIKNTKENEKFFDNLRYITLAGEATNNDDVLYINTKFPDIKVYVMYGQTEASARLSYLRPELLKDKLGSIGKGLCNVELKVVDETGWEIKPGDIGEIIARGPNIMKGYWMDPDATEEVIKGGWLYTGDNATVDEEGYIYIKGRKTDMIKHMGHRISPVEIENVINSCHFVKESAVVECAVDGAQVIKAFIVLEKECSIEVIRKFVNSKVPIYMRPHVFEVIDQLPRTESGKIKRSAVRST